MNNTLMVLSENKRTIKKYGIKKIGLFGSYLRGDFNSKSDIDILIEFENGSNSYSNLSGLYFYLEDLFHKKIDLVTVNALSPYIGPHILKEVRYVEGL